MNDEPIVQITLPAHFDGKQIVLDTAYPLEPDARLLGTVLSASEVAEEQRDWRHLSASGLSRTYSDDEIEYSLRLLKEPNPEYEPKG